MSKASQTTMTGLRPQPPYSWLSPTWTGFTRQAEEGRLPHAILLVGPNGVGCLELSMAMAQYLLCIAPQNGQSCGHCKSCHLVKVDGHPDLHILTLEVNEKTNKQAQAIKIQQIRAVSEIIANTAQQGGRKLIVIHPAEAMNVSAANALLKNLEEPNGDCVFILVSEQPAFLTATIRSRCSRIVVPIPKFSDALAWLQRNQITDAEKRLQDVGGRPLQVIEWLEKDLWGQQKQLSEQLQRLLSGQQHFIDCAKNIASTSPLWFLEQMQHWLTVVMPSVVNGLEVGGDGDPLLKILRKQAPSKLFKLYDNIQNKKKLVLSSANPNAQLIIEEVLMQIRDLEEG